MTQQPRKTDYVWPPHPFEEDVTTMKDRCLTCGRMEGHKWHRPPSDDLTREELVDMLAGDIEPMPTDWTEEELAEPCPEEDGWIEVGQVQPGGGMISYKRYPLRLIQFTDHGPHGFIIRFNKSEEATKEYNWDQIEWPWASIVQLRFKDNTPECRAAIKAWRKRHGEDI